MKAMSITDSLHGNTSEVASKMMRTRLVRITYCLANGLHVQDANLVCSLQLSQSKPVLEVGCGEETPDGTMRDDINISIFTDFGCNPYEPYLILYTADTARVHLESGCPCNALAVGNTNVHQAH